jgi:hypothetical protein
MKHTGSHTITIDSFDNIFCEFVQLENNIFECSKCGTKVTTIDQYSIPPNIPCRNPLLGEDVSNNIHQFISEMPDLKKDLCSVETIEHRHNICKSCSLFVNNTCSECGCSIVRDRNYLNKIAIKSESCPIGLWKESDV